MRGGQPPAIYVPGESDRTISEYRHKEVSSGIAGKAAKSGIEASWE